MKTSTTQTHLESIRAWLIENVTEFLDIESDDVDPHAPFASYGLDSADAVILVGELGEWLGRRLPATLVWDYPSIEAIVQYLDEEYDFTHSASAVVDSNSDDREPIAIIGMNCRFAGADSPEEFWELLCAGADAISEAPLHRGDFHPAYEPDQYLWDQEPATRWGGFLRQIDQFDAPFFGISPREADRMDPQQRIMLEVAWGALEDAGQVPTELAGTQTGIFIGNSTSDYGTIQLSAPAFRDAYVSTGSLSCVLANRLSYLLDLQGPSLSVDTACSSALVAVHLACQSIWNGESELALAGGINLILSPTMTVNLASAGFLSPDGKIRAFDAGANGYVRSEGAGVVVLKPLSQAQMDGDPIYAVICGGSVNQDGRSNGLTAPKGQAQEEVLRDAYRRARISPGKVQYVEAHGTGTSLGDPIEVQALGKVLQTDRALGNFCKIGSVKTNIGHAEAAAGIASVIKVALMIKHRQLVPSLHFEEPNPHIPWEQLPLQVQESTGHWPNGGAPLIAGINGFGFGGTNAHLVVAEPPQQPDDSAETPTRTPVILPISAHTLPALTELAERYCEYLETSDESLGDICYTAGVRRSHYEERLGIVAQSRDALIEKLRAFLDNEPAAGVARGQAFPGENHRLAFVFSGQGSHWAGMGVELLEQEPVFRAKLEECDTLLREFVDWSLIDELTAGEETSRLNETEVAQPAVFSMQVALAALWQSWGIEPDAVVGQSLGEVAAAHVAGALSLRDAVRVVHHRSRLMARVAGRGATAVVGLAPMQTQLVLAGFEDDVSLAGNSSPTASVISGDPEILTTILNSLHERDIFARMLKGVDIAFHSAHMDPLREELETVLADLSPQSTRVPIISSVTAERLAGDRFDAGYWSRNLRDPFKFADALAHLITNGHTSFVEVSPHAVLQGPIRQGLRHLDEDGTVLASMQRDTPGYQTLLKSLGDLYVAGASITWRAVYLPGGRVVSAPRYPWQHDRYWLPQFEGTRSQPGYGDDGLLGRHIEPATTSGQHLWETELHVSAPTYLADHQVQGAPVVPAAAYLEMLAGAADDAMGSACTIENVTLEQALFLPDTGSQVQVVLVKDDDTADVQVFSRPANSDLAWARHLTGRIRAGTNEQPTPIEVEQVRARCSDTVDAGAHYETMAAQGLIYGPQFQGVQNIWRRDREALAEITLPDVLHTSPSYHLHPVLWDAGFQVIAAAMPDEQNTTYLPVGIERAVVHEPAGDSLWCHVQLIDVDAHFAADITYMDEDGRVVAQVDGLRLQPLAQASGLRESYTIEWERRETPTVTQTGGHWLVFADGETGPALCEQLDIHGCTTALVRPGDTFSVETNATYRVNPKERADFERLLAVQPNVHGVIHAWDADTPPPSELPGSTPDNVHVHGVESVLHLTQALASAGGSTVTQLWLVTRNAQAVVDNDEVNVWQAPMWGMGRVVAVEHPELWGGLIDTGVEDDTYGGVVAEILSDDTEGQVAYRGDRRYVVRLKRRPITASPQQAPVRSDGVYLITGGFGGLGRTVARWLVEQGARHLMLLSRSGVPPRKQWDTPPSDSRLAARIETIRRLEAAGATVNVASVDVTDKAALSETLQAVTQPIRGVVHAAGINDDQLLLRMQSDTLYTVLAPKVRGAWLLHKHVPSDTLDFFVSFSSVASVLGSIGQANYAAGNAFLDALAHYRRRQGLPATSINWGPWAEVGMAARDNLAEEHAERGMLPIAPDEGVELFGRLLVEDPVQVVAASVDWAQMAAAATSEPPALLSDILAAGAGTTNGDLTGDEAFLGELLMLDESARRDRVTEHIRGIVGDVLRLPPERLNPRQPLNQLGLDSIMAVEVKTRIERSLGVPIAVVDLLRGTSVHRIATDLTDQLWDEEDQLEQVLTHVEGMSLDEVQAMLDNGLDE